jgi:hypothetical protein
MKRRQHGLSTCMDGLSRCALIGCVPAPLTYLIVTTTTETRFVTTLICAE